MDEILKINVYSKETSIVAKNLHAEGTVQLMCLSRMLASDLESVEIVRVRVK